ncbi:MAG: hypothetical protein MJE77_42085 [Proteobacteria bacterium]|nr:hypothetical protein [Pseudomonadota bacterium]
MNTFFSRLNCPRRAALIIYIVISLTGVFALGGCADELAAYNELSEFRVLALRSSQPVLAPDAVATVEPLVFVPGETAVSYAWSWCPLPAEEDGDLRCAIAHEDLAATVRKHAGTSEITVPAYDLGSADSVQFGHFLPAQSLAAICYELAQKGISRPLELPDCEVGMPFVITLRAESGTAVTAAKELVLLASEPQALNQNPLIRGVSVAAVDDSAGTPMTMPADQPIPLAQETEYELILDIAPDSVERYRPVKDSQDSPAPTERAEQLAITWFVEGGETEFTRTSFIEGESDLDTASRNQWTTPAQSGNAELHFVIRDDRGGLNWLSRQAVIE